MDSEILATNILKSIINRNVKDVSKYLVFPNSYEITNTVRKQLNNLSANELKSVQLFLYNIFNSCYNGNLFQTNTHIELPKLTVNTRVFIEYPKFSKTKIQFLKSLKEKLGAKYSS